MPLPSRSAAFRAVFDAHHLAIRAYCIRRLPVADADDAVAEVFLTYWRKLDDAPAEPNCRPWLYGVARNVVRNSRRSNSRFSRLKDRASRQPVPHVESPEIVVVRGAEEERLYRVLDRLRPGEREILLLRAWEELSSAEIATVMGLTPKAVDNQLARVRKKLTKVAIQGVAMNPTARPQAVNEGGKR